MTETLTPQELDHGFEALANKHRREIIYALSLQPAIHKHIKILEKANMIIRRKVGRTNYLSLNRESLRSVQDWLMQFHAYWGSDEETLENYAQYLGKENDQEEKK